MSRYDNREVVKNNHPLYEEVRREKNLDGINQYTTPTLKYPSVSQIGFLTVVNHRWRRGDRFYKLANQYYNDTSMWWVIAQFNKKPTEFGIKYGDLIMIPTPLELVLEAYRTNTNGAY